MRIGAVGDIHGNYAGLKKAFEVAGPVDRWWFTGDGYREIARFEAEYGIKVEGVAGNCDLFTEYPEEQLLQVGEHRILITHGHLYGVKQGLTRLALAGQSSDVALVVFGHTHLPLDELWQNIRLFNPGSLSQDRSAGGPGYGVIEITRDGIKTSLHRL